MRVAESEVDLITKASKHIAKFEGVRYKAYWDVKGWAICYGNNGYKGQRATVTQCNRKLYDRIESVNNYVTKLFPNKEFTQNQRIALISLYYNVKNPYHVTWRIRNDKSKKSVANALRMYDWADGKQLKGLTKRRQNEANLYLN